jgi:histidine ammonia-lyase
LNTVIAIDGQSLSLAQFQAVVLDKSASELTRAARQRVVAGREVVERVLTQDEAVYGVNTGFGDLSDVRIAAEQLAILQQRLIISHCAGVGDALSDAVVRGMLLLRANTLARGHSGVRPDVIDSLLALLNADVLPLVPSRGSVGASGDLAPLAHLALPLLGKGRVRIAGKERTANEGLRKAGIKPLVLQPKEGLALINGTQGMTSILALVLIDGHRLTRIADLVSAMSTDALRGTDTAFDQRLHALRPYPGQQASAANLRQLLHGSDIRESHRQNDVRVQDPYSVRCIPQVHGAVRDVLVDTETKVAIEMNAVTDNPLVFPEDDEILSGGNFHGEPMALAADTLAIGLSELGAISERRIEKLTNTAFSGLPPFLIEDAGLNSGFMMAQVTAAALASENKTLCHPATVDSIPTSADKEDHVSMGMWAALKLRQVLTNSTQILAIELLAAAQGIDLLRPLKSSPPLEHLHATIRKHLPAWTQDRETAADIAVALQFLDEIDPIIADLR